jgi:hypothetical protein
LDAGRACRPAPPDARAVSPAAAEGASACRGAVAGRSSGVSGEDGPSPARSPPPVTQDDPAGRATGPADTPRSAWRFAIAASPPGASPQWAPPTRLDRGSTKLASDGGHRLTGFRGGRMDLGWRLVLPTGFHALLRQRPLTKGSSGGNPARTRQHTTLRSSTSPGSKPRHHRQITPHRAGTDARWLQPVHT